MNGNLSFQSEVIVHSHLVYIKAKSNMRQPTATIATLCLLLFSAHSFPQGQDSQQDFPHLDGSARDFPDEAGDGDIIIPKIRIPRNAELGGDYDPRWPNGIVPYLIDSVYTAEQEIIIRQALDEFRKHSCVQFVPYTGREKNHILITYVPNQGCSSAVGRVPSGEQVVQIEAPICVAKGYIMHELMHAIGFDHEQNRPDRDQYVKIYLDNVRNITGREANNFQLNENINTFNLPYDYQSIMHYSNTAFSKGNYDTYRPTIVAKVNPTMTVGQREGFSKFDVYKIHFMYNCRGGIAHTDLPPDHQLTPIGSDLAAPY